MLNNKIPKIRFFESDTLTPSPPHPPSNQVFLFSAITSDFLAINSVIFRRFENHHFYKLRLNIGCDLGNYSVSFRGNSAFKRNSEILPKTLAIHLDFDLIENSGPWNE